MKKSIFSVCLFFACLLPIYCFGGCIEGDCHNGTGTYIGHNDLKYEGEFKDSIPNGQGTFTWRNGRVYTGEVRNGFPHGYGTMNLPGGDTQTGYWTNGEYAGADKP